MAKNFEADQGPDHSIDNEAARTGFPLTRWTLVLQASEGEETVRQKALSELCEIYWHPLYSFIRHRGATREEAMDLTQGFFVRLLSQDRLAHLQNAEGRLRTYLLAAVKNFVTSEFTKREALKRGGGVTFEPLDHENAESRYQAAVTDQETPERLYERLWARTLLNKAYERVERTYQESGRAQIFGLLKGGIAVGSERPSMVAAASKLGMKEGAVRVQLHRLRKAYRAALEFEIAETVSTDDEVGEEINYLLSVF